MIIEMIVAHSKNYCIGINNKLPWILKDDLKNFKNLTKHNVVIMGRKTYESIGNPLPDRINIILTRKKEYSVEGAYVLNSKEDVFKFLDKENRRIFIIGGIEIYNLFLEDIYEFHITEVNASVEGDSYLTKPLWENLPIVEKREFIKNDRNEYDFIYKRYIKNSL